MSSIDYGSLYTEYWSRPDRWGSHSFTDPEQLVQRVLTTCGGGELLDVGCGMGLLVRSLLAKGVDARGLDVAENAIEYCARLVPGRYDLGSILDIPHPADSFETVVTTDVLEHLEEEDVPQALSELHRVTRRYVVAALSTAPDRDQVWHLTVRDREWWERRFFEAGFRRHPLMMSVVPYGALEQEGDQITLLFEKLPPGTREEYSDELLEQHRMLHMDMLRDCGRRSDAHVARYDLARSYVRPGDVVLDVACGLGYGAAVLAAGSPASRIVGVDESEYAIRYARDCYAATCPALEFHQGDAYDLAFLDDDSVDYVVSFETLEHLAEPERFLLELRRVLRPSGRIVVSVPNDWSDETGEDPSPYHLHVYDWGTLRDQIGRLFRVEKAFAQTAGGARKLTNAPRTLHEVPLEGGQDRPAEWWLMLAMKDPVGADAQGYRETSFPDHGHHEDFHITAFGRDYDDPWIVKGMVSIGMRTTNEHDLRAMAEEVLASGRPGSADVGAAICVLAYQALQRPREDNEEIQRLLEQIAQYHAEADDTSHAWRWRISNQFVAARLWLAMGRREEAFEAFLECAQMDYLRFAPILATKAVDALFQAGLMAAGDGDLGRARECWTRSIQEAQRAVQADWRNVWGEPERPISFGLPEATQVLDLATGSAYALDALEGWSERPGWSWKQAFGTKTRELEGWRSAAGFRQTLLEHAECRQRATAAEAEHARSQAARLQGELEQHARALQLAQGELAARSADLSRVQGELAKARAEGERLFADLTRIYESGGWALLSRFYRLRARFFPADTRRGDLARLAKRSLRGGPAAGAGTTAPGLGARTKRTLKGLRSRLRRCASFCQYHATAWTVDRRYPRAPGDGKQVAVLQVGSFDKGGLEEVVLGLARNLTKQGTFHVVVLVVEGSIGHLGSVAQAQGIEVIALDDNPFLLRRLIRRLGVDVAHLSYTVFGVEEYARAGVPVVYTIQNTYIWADPEFVAERAAAYAEVSQFVAVSEPVKAFFAHRCEVDPSRIQVIPNPLDLEFVAEEEPVERSSLGYGDDDVVFINVSTFNYHKFHVLMVAAMERVVRELPQAKMLFVGNVHDPRCKEYVEAQIARRGLQDSIQILDFAPKGRLMGLLKLADCFVLPSLIEGWSVAVNEALYCGLPLILSDIGSARAVIEDGDIGIIVRNPFPDLRELTTRMVVERFSDDAHLENLDDLVDAMLTVGRDLDAWKVRAAAGHDKVVERYSSERLSREYAACFERLISRSRAHER